MSSRLRTTDRRPHDLEGHTTKALTRRQGCAWLAAPPALLLGGCLASTDTPGGAAGGSSGFDFDWLRRPGGSPITTSLADAIYADPNRDRHSPAATRSLEVLRSPQQAGTFTLRAGHYAMLVQSYCLQAGTYAPGGGDGYLYAPVLGPAREVVVAIVQNSATVQAVAQRDVQSLLWAILARTRPTALSPHLQAVAARLLTPALLSAWTRLFATDLLRDAAQQQLMARASPQLRAVLDAEHRLRTLFTSGASFSDLERAAVLLGVAPLGEGSTQVPAGRWSRHPDGYWVRYLPQSYSTTRFEVAVDTGSAAVGRVLDPALHIAMPGNTARQRLIQSARATGG